MPGPSQKKGGSQGRSVSIDGVSGIIYNLFLLLLFPLLQLVAILSSKGKEFVATRKGAVGRVRSYDASRKSLWLHASSVGEFDQALAIARAYRAKEPKTPIVLSYFSNSARRDSHPDFDLVFPLPLDFPWVWSWWMEQLNPLAFVTMTWDVFPNLLRALEKKGIPSYLACGALDPSSRRLRFPYLPLLRPVYSRFSGIGVVDENQLPSFRRLTRFPDRVRITGDSRYDTIVYKSENLKLDGEIETRIATLAKKKRIWILGSTYKACDEAVLPGMNDLLESHPDWMVLAFPHHVDGHRLSELEENCHRYGIETLRWSRWNGTDPVPSFLIVDQMGILALAYRSGRFAYVGGGFHFRIHNTGEPAAMGLPVLTGPSIHTSPVALLLEKNGHLSRCDTGEVLLNTAKEWMENDTGATPPQPKARDLIQGQTGSAENFIKEFL